MLDSSTKKRKSQEHKNHWFRKYAETVPVQYLANALVGAVRVTVYTFGSDREKMRKIRELVEIFDELDR